jgi:hypothetical protein
MLALALAVAALAAGGTGQASAATDRAAAAPLRCPATFHVLHNDRIGRLRLPEGHYRIRLLDDQSLTCERAAKLFARFLQDFDGELPGQWRLRVGEATFVKRGTDVGFSVKKARRSGSGGGRHPSGRHEKCPTFEVLHNDRIGDVRFPRGTYQMTALGGFSCQKASKRFADFLQLPEGNLPHPWKLRGRTGTFERRRTGKGFQVNFWQR